MWHYEGMTTKASDPQQPSDPRPNEPRPNDPNNPQPRPGEGEDMNEAAREELNRRKNA
jgi:hypothetical protein